MNINYLLQQKTYDFRMNEQQAKHDAFEIQDSADYFKEETDGSNVLEQEVAEAIVGNKNIEYPIEEYYKTYFIPQTEEGIKEKKE